MHPPSLPHSFNPGSKPIFSINPFHHRLPISSGLPFTDYLNLFFCPTLFILSFLFVFISFFLATCGRLSWLPVSIFSTLMYVRRLWQPCISELWHYVIFTHLTCLLNLKVAQPSGYLSVLQDYIILTAKCRRHLWISWEVSSSFWYCLWRLSNGHSLFTWSATNVTKPRCATQPRSIFGDFSTTSTPARLSGRSSPASSPAGGWPRNVLG